MAWGLDARPRRPIEWSRERRLYHPFYNKGHAALTKGVLEGQNEKDV